MIVCLALNILLLSEQYNYNRIIEKLVKNPDLTQQRNAVVSQSEPADNPTVASENSIETIGFIDPQFKDDFFDLEKLEKDFDAITNPSVQHPKVFPGSPEQPNSIQVAALVTGVNSLPSSSEYPSETGYRNPGRRSRHYPMNSETRHLNWVLRRKQIQVQVNRIRLSVSRNRTG